MASPVYLRAKDGSLRAYVRHRAGEPVALWLWAPRQADEPHPPCAHCGAPIQTGESSTLIPAVPTDRDRPMDRWGNWLADEVHAHCIEAYLALASASADAEADADANETTPGAAP
jgi:hypothetical protein